MRKTKGPVIMSALLIILGLGWLLNNLNVMHTVDWVWTGALAGVGVIVLAMGLDKVTLVVGGFLLIASCMSLLRQTGRLTTDVEVPALVITLGVLLLVSHLAPIRKPDWLVASEGDQKK